MSTLRRMHPDSVYTLDIGGAPALAFAAYNKSDASTLLKETWFVDDLKTARSNGKPLWDGSATLAVRASNVSEAQRYKQAADAIIDGSEDDLFIAYLVEIDR